MKEVLDLSDYKHQIEIGVKWTDKPLKVVFIDQSDRDFMDVVEDVSSNTEWFIRICNLNKYYVKEIKNNWLWNDATPFFVIRERKKFIGSSKFITTAEKWVSLRGGVM